MQTEITCAIAGGLISGGTRLAREAYRHGGFKQALSQDTFRRTLLRTGRETALGAGAGYILGRIGKAFGNRATEAIPTSAIGEMLGHKVGVTNVTHKTTGQSVLTEIWQEGDTYRAYIQGTEVGKLMLREDHPKYLNQVYIAWIGAEQGNKQYKGIGSALHQVAAEVALQKQKPLKLMAIKSSEAFHYKCGFRPSETQNGYTAKELTDALQRIINGEQNVISKKAFQNCRMNLPLDRIREIYGSQPSILGFAAL